MTKNKKIIFFGTPLIAANCIQALIDKKYSIQLLVCPPDKPFGRKQEINFCETKKLALLEKIEIVQPKNLNDIISQIKFLKPDLILTCAYGKIIPEEILSIPKYKCINVHASLLPKYRGGAPIHWSIINGEQETGITLMYMEKGMDTGNIITSQKIRIDFEDNLDSLFFKMENLAYKIIYENIDILFDENLISYPQVHSEASFAYNIKRSDEKINWKMPAVKIFNLIRGLSSKIGAYSSYNGKELKIFKATIINQEHNYVPGTIIDNKNQVIIAAQENLISIQSIQFSGKKRIDFEQLKSISKNFKINSKFE